MRHVLEIPSGKVPHFGGVFDQADAKALFQQRFRCALLQCLRRGFQVEECFGIIWEETLDEVRLSSREQKEVFPEMIEWARGWMRRA